MSNNLPLSPHLPSAQKFHKNPFFLLKPTLNPFFKTLEKPKKPKKNPKTKKTLKPKVLRPKY
jgi:hypothetical protein